MYSCICDTALWHILDILRMYFLCNNEYILTKLHGTALQCYLVKFVLRTIIIQAM